MNKFLLFFIFFIGVVSIGSASAFAMDTHIFALDTYKFGPTEEELRTGSRTINHDYTSIDSVRHIIEEAKRYKDPETVYVTNALVLASEVDPKRVTHLTITGSYITKELLDSFPNLVSLNLA